MPETILIIDDSKLLHALVKAQLGTEHYTFESAYSGSLALGMAALIRPDLILLDVDLPDMNGFDICRFLKANALTARIPVIFLTASDSTDEKICGLDLQPADYVTKPFDPQELAYRVRAALRTKKSLDRLPATMVEEELTESLAQSPAAKLTLSRLLASRYDNAMAHQPAAGLASG